MEAKLEPGRRVLERIDQKAARRVVLGFWCGQRLFLARIVRQGGDVDHRGAMGTRTAARQRLQTTTRITADRSADIDEVRHQRLEVPVSGILSSSSGVGVQDREYVPAKGVAGVLTRKMWV